MALPQEVLRQRTRQDLLRQRQQQLKRKIEEPKPEQPQATPQEIEEYRRLKQQYEAQQEELQGAISNIDEQISRKAIDLQSIQRSIQEIQDKGGSTPSGMKATANNISEEIARLNARKSILSASHTIEEARVRQSYYRGQVAEQLAPTPRIIEPDIPIAQPGARYVPIAPIYEAGKRVGWRYYDTLKGTTISSAQPTPYRYTPQVVTELGKPLLTAREETALGGGYLSTLYSQTAITEREVAEAVSGIQPQYLTYVKGAPVPKRAALKIDPIKEPLKYVAAIQAGALVPTKEGERLVREQLEKTLPGRYQLARMERVVGEDEFNVIRTISESYWKTSEFLAEKTISALKKAGISTSLLEKEITLPGWAKDLPGHLAIWILFSPAMGSGSAAQELMYKRETKLVYDYVKGKWVKVDKVTGKVIPEMTRAEALGEFGRLSEQRQLQILKKAFKGVKDESGNILKKVYLDKASLLKDITKAKDFMRNAGLSEAQIEARINLLFPKLKPRPPTQIQAEVQAAMPQQLVGVDWLSGGASAIQAEAVGQVQFQRYGQPLISALAGLSRLAQRQLARQRQLFFQPQVPLLKIPQVPILKIPQIPRLGQPRIPRVPKKPRIKIPPPPPPPPPPPLSEASIKKVEKALKELRGKSVNVLVGMEKKKQKIIYKNLPPREAYMKAQQFVDKNIQASFRIIPTGKKTKKKDIKKVMYSGKFRPSKREPLYQVEKRKYRLDMPTEKKQIKRAKRRKGK